MFFINYKLNYKAMYKLFYILIYILRKESIMNKAQKNEEYKINNLPEEKKEAGKKEGGIPNINDALEILKYSRRKKNKK
jgi:hypothetical protein